ncbi:MAG: phosphatidylglycerophosphatase A [Fidelibacterota bacterium]|nr:MAG: phosphatidylglycerophosphatase A [Candidatus Neomarinimicrobiota bacterium]
MNTLTTIIGTFGLTGYLKPAPGTWGSLAAALVWWFVIPSYLAIQLLFLALAAVAGTWAAGVMEQRSEQHDPSIVVIDEAAGMWCALLGARQVWWYFLAAFLIFRLLDVLKPGPIHRIQNIPGGWGIMLDDLAAGAVTLVVMSAVRMLI